MAFCSLVLNRNDIYDELSTLAVSNYINYFLNSNFEVRLYEYLINLSKVSEKQNKKNEIELSRIQAIIRRMQENLNTILEKLQVILD